VLFGIRGDDPHILPEAMSSISSEAISRWALFETNQGTDEHLQRKKSTSVRRYDSVIISGAVTNEPVTLAGGHVIFSIADDCGAIDCAAYEPTKQFRNVIKALKRGDAVDVYGSVHRKEGTVNLEKICVRKLVRVQKKVANPLCRACNKRMKSKGRQQGYKCPSCGATAAEIDAVFSEVPRTLTKGFYEVPVCARRHLSMPLKRIANKRNKTL
jgi:tRNA(Ile2)-agmatinylcytidine synthase